MTWRVVDSECVRQLENDSQVLLKAQIIVNRHVEVERREKPWTGNRQTKEAIQHFHIQYIESILLYSNIKVCFTQNNFLFAIFLFSQLGFSLYSPLHRLNTFLSRCAILVSSCVKKSCPISGEGM